MAIQKLGDLATKAFVFLNKLQQGTKQLLLTGYPCIDEHIGGLLPGDAVAISAPSSHGKSEMAFRIKENILNVKLNPSAENFVWLEYNLEVKVFNVILRGLNRRMKKKKRDIISKEFSNEEKKTCAAYFEETQDKRQFVCQESVTADEFYETTHAFLKENADKDACCVSFDHTALIGDRNKTEGIERLISYMNRLKLEFENVYFFPISQLNRNFLDRVEERSNRSAPNAGDIYQSSTIDHIANYNIIIFNAYKVGIEQFLKVNPSRYDYLSDHFGGEDSKGKVSFNTMGKLFYFVIKTRETDEPWKNLYIENMDISTEELDKMKSDTQDEENAIPVFKAMPVFGNQNFDKNEEEPF